MMVCKRCGKIPVAATHGSLCAGCIENPQVRVELPTTYMCMRLRGGDPCGNLVEVGTNCDAQHDPAMPVPEPSAPLPASEICKICSHPRAVHTPGKTPPCEKGDGAPCFCGKFTAPPDPPPGLAPDLAFPEPEMVGARLFKDQPTETGTPPGYIDFGGIYIRAPASALSEAQSRPINQAPETAKLSNPKGVFGSNKLPLHLWPTTATAMGCLAFLHGALKYGKHNWRGVGVRVTTYVDALYRHMAAWYEGEDLDPDSGLSHLAHALACIAVLVDAEAAGKLNDDRAYPGGYGKLTAELTKLVAKLKEAAPAQEPKHYTRENGP